MTSNLTSSSTLYIIATPIGNLKDITLRALETLESLNYIACEDTRVSAKLLQHYNIKATTFSYHDHNEEYSSKRILELLRQGNDVGLISDCGMPMVSDPGHFIVQKCIEENINITCIPGASSSITALALSGLPNDSFYFIGFLPSKESARISKLEEISNLKTTIICFESARRLIDSLNNIKQVLGDVKIAVARELTKKFEEIKRDSISNLINYYSEVGAPKGEIVLVIDNSEFHDYLSEKEIDDKILTLLKEYKVKDISNQLAEAYGLNKKEIYKRVLELKEKC